MKMTPTKAGQILFRSVVGRILVYFPSKIWEYNKPPFKKKMSFFMKFCRWLELVKAKTAYIVVVHQLFSSRLTFIHTQMWFREKITFLWQSFGRQETYSGIWGVLRYQCINHHIWTVWICEFSLRFLVDQ